MDPSATLAQVRKILTQKNLKLSECILVLDAIQNLDEWITRHGELPRQWKKAHDLALRDLAYERNASLRSRGASRPKKRNSRLLTVVSD